MNNLRVLSCGVGLGVLGPSEGHVLDCRGTGEAKLDPVAFKCVGHWPAIASSGGEPQMQPDNWTCLV